MASPAALGALSAKQQRQLRAQLDAVLPRPLPPGAPITASFKSEVLRGLRSLDGLLALPRRQRRPLQRRLEQSLAQVLADTKLRPQDLGAKTFLELAEVLLRWATRVAYGSYTVRELRAKRRGLRGNFMGEAFELFVYHFEVLHGEFKKIATQELKDLRQMLKEGSKLLVNVDRATFSLKGKFTDVQRATNIYVLKGRKRLKFTDLSYVTVFTPEDAGGTWLSFLVDIELKLPTAGKKLGKQVGAAPSRYKGADAFELQLESGDVIFVPADRVLFNLRGRTAVGVVPTTQTSPHYRWASTQTGGYVETYLRAGVTIRTEALRRLIDVVLVR